MEEKQLSVTVADLISAGLINAPAKATAVYAGTVLKADLTADGQFKVGGEKYTSPSSAAGHAIAATLKRTTHNRKYLSVNGWKLWRVTDASGRERFLSEIRADFDPS